MRLGFFRRPPIQPETPVAKAVGGGTTSWRALYLEAATFVSRAILLGFVCGALIGGAGGRLAMFVLRVTSDDSLRGRETDDGFIIGEFSGDTVFLVFLTALAGAFGGLVYLGVRDWLPRRWRPVLFGLLGATAGGALVIRPDGIDFTLLEPLSLAVAMFVALPAAYGVALSLLTERFLPTTSHRPGRWQWVAILPLGLALPTGPIGLGALLLMGLAVAANRSGGVVRLWRSTPVTWLGRGVFAAAIGFGGFLLARDVVAVL